MGVQARQLVRIAKKHQITPRRGAPWACAVGIMSYDVKRDWDAYRNTIANHFNITTNDVAHVEAGFEGWEVSGWIENGNVNPKNRYYKVGRRFAELLGLSKVKP